MPEAGKVIDRLVAIDCRIFDAVAGSQTPVLDRLLPPLTRSANNSLIWIVTSGLLGAFGGRRGQRAALRGIGSIGLTSLFVNQVVKRLVRRPRPPLRQVAAARRPRRPPLTTPFPSGPAAAAGPLAFCGAPPPPPVPL